MSKALIVDNITYNYPEQGDDPPWGEEATDWAEAVTNVLSSLLSVDDILQTSFTISNNTSSATDVTGLAFDATSARTASIGYFIYRSTTLSSTISSNSAANPTVVTTSAAHSLSTGDKVTITGSNSTPSINGEYEVTVLSSTTFSIPVNVSVSGSAGTVTLSDLAEKGVIETIYRDDSNSWEFSREAVGDSGVTFTITAAGQVQYTSTNMPGTSYSGLMKFKASALQQT